MNIKRLIRMASIAPLFIISCTMTVKEGSIEKWKQEI